MKSTDEHFQKRPAVLIDRSAARLAEMTVLALAVFTALNLMLGIIHNRLSCNWLWLNIDDTPLAFGWILLGIFSAGVLGYRWLNDRLRIAVRAIAGAIGLACLADAASFYRLLATGEISSNFPLPLSLILGVLIVYWALRAPQPPPLTFRWIALRGILCAGAAGLSLLTQVLTFGMTDYRRPADAIVVFGAGVRPSGQPSRALSDRVKTGCELYHEGLADRLVFSGGRDSRAPVSEPEAMRKLALRMGVPEQAIILDEQGINTLATLRNVKALAEKHGWRDLLMVSHDYHLSRISMLSHRLGLHALTVPAYEPARLQLKAFYIQRELAAWCYYYLTGAAEGPANPNAP